MRLNKKIFTVSALAFALSVGGLSAEAAQQRDNRDRNGGRASQGQARASHGNGDNHHGDDRSRFPPATTAIAETSIAATRTTTPRRAWSFRTAPTEHYYGSGGHLSVFFNLGSGYRYGSPYYGRVYGGPVSLYGGGGRLNYGDVRLQVRPRGAAVYVDGYYAGVVDDFDGVFQRLTLVVGRMKSKSKRRASRPRCSTSTSTRRGRWTCAATCILDVRNHGRLGNVGNRQPAA